MPATRLRWLCWPARSRTPCWVTSRNTSSTCWRWAPMATRASASSLSAAPRPPCCAVARRPCRCCAELPAHIHADARRSLLGGRRRIRRPPLIALVGEKLAGQQYLQPVPLRIRLALDIDGNVDGAHDPVTELLVNQLLDGGAVHADDFVPAVDEWISGHGGGQCTFVGHDLQPGHRLVGQFEQVTQRLGLGLVEGHLAQTAGGDKLLRQPHHLGNLLPFKALAHLAGDDQTGNFFAT